MAAWLEAAKDSFQDSFQDSLNSAGERFGNFIGEALLGLGATGLASLVWCGFQPAPYLTVSILAGVLLFAGYGITAMVTASVLALLVFPL